jgi:hypothetical protein
MEEIERAAEEFRKALQDYEEAMLNQLALIREIKNVMGGKDE